MTATRTETAVETAAAIRAGTLTSRAAVEAALARIERSQPATNAWQVVRREKALAEAEEVDARADRASLPLAGVPVAIKDNVAVAGEPKRDGSVASDARPQDHDDEVVRRLRAAGAVVVGLTRVPELCIWGATDSAYGVTRNPWAPDRTPGGSSGGSAAAVAAGDVPLAHGNDGMGSVRIPAACCGLVGIKPGTGVVPSGLGANSWHGMAENGVLATTVADAALMLSVLADEASYAGIGATGSLRVAVSTKAPGPGVVVARAWAEATRRTASLLARDHEIVERDPRYPLGLTPAALALWTTGTALDADLLPDPSRLEPRSRRHAAVGRALARTGQPKDGPREQWRRRAEELFADIDVLVTPALAQPPIPAREWFAGGWLRSILANARYAPFAAPWNVVGWPAMTVPAGLDPAGRPVAVQLVGRPGSERTLVALAGEVERLQPWPRTAPADRWSGQATAASSQ